MHKTIKYTSTVFTIIVLLWIMMSWVDVINHNDPFETDGSPSGWNAFVVLTEVAE